MSATRSGLMMAKDCSKIEAKRAKGNVVDNADSSDSDVVKDNVEDLGDGCTLPVMNTVHYGAAIFLVLGLFLLVPGLFASNTRVVPVVLSVFPLSLGLLFAFNARRMGADIVINDDAVYRRRSDTVYDLVEWKNVAAIELYRAGGARGGRVFTAYRLIMKQDKSGREKTGFGVGRNVLRNPGRLIRYFNHYAARYEIPIVADNRFTKRKLEQIPYEEIDWDQLSILTGHGPPARD